MVSTISVIFEPTQDGRVPRSFLLSSRGAAEKPNTYGSIYFSFQSHPVSHRDCSGEVILDKRSQNDLNKEAPKIAEIDLERHAWRRASSFHVLYQLLSCYRPAKTSMLDFG